MGLSNIFSHLWVNHEYTVGLQATSVGVFSGACQSRGHSWRF